MPTSRIRSLVRGSGSAPASCSSWTTGPQTDVFGPVDAMKLRSSMTLFARADPEERLFRDVLDRYFEGVADDATDVLLSGPTR